MGKILRLPAHLANQIAAGEVVERPASVIKELVENAIDAGATRISITTEFGGKRLIRVEDDGEGMVPEDARLAIERHATSKLRRVDDLERIATLGFRGEALPSIASVSHFILRTRAKGADAGLEIRVDGGAPAAERVLGMPEGTSVEVADLFYNLSARRKFLKADSAEAAQVSKIVTQLALCYPEIGFTLSNNGRRVLQVPPVATRRERLFQLYGERTDLVAVSRERGDVTVVGFVAALAEHGPTRGPQNLFLNRRIIKDRTIAHAIIDAYSVASIKERSPEVHLFIDMPPEAVDVNVHPTKAEVRFRDQSYMHEVVRRAVGEALGQAPIPEFPLAALSRGEMVPTTLSLPQTYPAVLPSRWADAANGVREATAGATFVDALPVRPVATTDRPMMALGQFRDTFIVAVDDEGIVIIDQHVAHERVLFEQISAGLKHGRLEAQRLLVPLLVALSTAGREALLAHANDLDRLGFDVEPFGGDEVRVSAIPALLTRDECDATLRAMAEDLEGLDHGAGVDAAIDRIAATTACHAAVKANYPLTAAKMAHILEALRQTAFSTICPHGRPVMLRVTRREVERSFQRT